jgi:iron(III) transport system substrate-binding protein
MKMLKDKYSMQSIHYFGQSIFILVVFMITVTAGYAEDTAALIEAAKKEGTVVYYSGMATQDCATMTKEFEKKYPFVKVETFRLSGENLLLKAQTEARAKGLRADIFQASIIQVNQMKSSGLLQKYVSPESKNFPAKFRDAEGYWNATYVLPYVMIYNTKLIPKQEAPKTYEDLLNPKWKKKIGLAPDDDQWFFHLVKIMGREKGIDYMKNLAKQDLIVRRGHTLLTTLCAAGEIPIVIVNYLDAVEQVKAKGAAIEWIRFESFPIITAINAIGVVSTAPHLNAAKLFYDFVISKEGAKIFRSISRIPPNPEEQPQNVKGLNLYVAVPDEFMANYKQIEKEWEEIFHLRR